MLIDCDLRLSGWCDSNWASCPLTRQSLSSWLIFLGISHVSEYQSMATLTCELKWLKGLFGSLGVRHPLAMNLYCDSQYSALYLAQNPVFHERTKHIEVDCHF